MSSQLIEQAIVVSSKTSLSPDRKTTQLALFDTSGDPVTYATEDHTHTGDEVIMTGYVGVSADAVAATDDVLTAIAKLEARISALESA